MFAVVIFFVIDTSNRFSSSQSLYIDSYCFGVIYCVFSRRRNQYKVSFDSFSDIYSLAIKSFLLIAHCASAMFAPILVPLRNIWSAILYSCFSSFRNRHNPIIRIEKFMHLSSKRLPKSLIFCDFKLIQNRIAIIQNSTIQNRIAIIQNSKLKTQNYNSMSTLNSSCQGRPCLLSCSMNGSGSNSSTFHTPGLRQRPLKNIMAPIIAGTPVV